MQLAMQTMNTCYGGMMGNRMDMVQMMMDQMVQHQQKMWHQT